MGYGNLERLAIIVLATLSPACTAQTSSRPETSGASSSVRSIDHAPSIVTDFSSLVRANGGAVVNISATGTHSAPRMEQLWPPAGSQDNPMFRLFQQFPYGFPVATGAPVDSLGSGFIVNPGGYVLTDSRLVAGATKIKVTLRDGRELRATVIGDDPASGVALLKIPATGLPAVRIGSSAHEKAGNWIASIWNPYGLSDTVTAGIIANMSREMPQNSYIPLIQTDMTESAGDAGSPVFNLNGEVIGIETPVQGAVGNVDGIAFAIPINEAMKVERQLLQHRKVEHGRLGITIQEVSGPLAHSFGLSKPEGALVSFVDPGGPSAKSGLRPGDVIQQINGVAITDSSSLPVAVADLEPGSTVRLAYWRDNADHQASVVLGRLNAAALEPAAGAQTSAPDGLTVRGLTAEERHEAGIKAGVRVEKSVGPAAFAGIEPGDIILMVNNAPVANPSQFSNKIQGSGNSVALLIERNGQRMFVSIDMS